MIISSPIRPVMRQVVVSPIDQAVQSIFQQALAVLRTFGSDAHMYLPGVGYVNGTDAGNWLDTAFAATAVDSPVGLVMDAANTARGAELVVGAWATPTFFDNVTTGTGSSVAATPGTTGSRSAVGFTTIAGKTYVASWKIVTSGATLSVFCRDGVTLGSGTVIASDTTGAQGVIKSLVFTAASANSNLLLSTNTAAPFSVSDISVREVTGAIYASNNTTAQKPILRRTPILGANSVTNGEFATDLSGWTAGMGWMQMSGAANYLGTGGYLEQAIPTVAGRTYIVNATSSASALCGAWDSPGQSGALSGSPGTRSGAIEFSFVASDSTSYIAFSGGSAYTLDNVTVKEVTGYSNVMYHQYAAASSQRLSLSAVPFLLSDDHCVVSAFSAVLTAGRQALYSCRNSTATNQIGSEIGINASGFVYARNRDDAGLAFELVGSSNVTGSGKVASVRRLGSTVDLRVDGTQVSTGTLPAFGPSTNNTATLGAGWTTSITDFWNGSKHGDIIIKGSVSDAQLLTLTRCLAAFQGRTI